MADRKRTPGKWYCAGEEPRNGYVRCETWSGLGLEVADVSGRNIDEIAANTRLIAAAPELLEALIRGELMIRRLHRGEMLTADEIAAYLPVAESALDKATT